MKRLALALPEAVEQDHHGRPSFRVDRKIFATQWDEHIGDVAGIESGLSAGGEEAAGRGAPAQQHQPGLLLSLLRSNPRTDCTGYPFRTRVEQPRP